MSTAAHVSGYCELECPQEKFAELERDFEQFLETKPKSFLSEPVFQLDTFGEQTILAPYSDGHFSWTEWEEIDCWLRFITEDFFRPRKIKLSGDFHCEDSSGELSKLIVTRSWRVKWQEGEIRWKKAFSPPYKFPDEMRKHLSE
jgi:hypothetical protein